MAEDGLRSVSDALAAKGLMQARFSPRDWTIASALFGATDGGLPSTLSADDCAGLLQVVVAAAERRVLRQANVVVQPVSLSIGSAAVLAIINDDMPFLVDSVMAEIRAAGLSVQSLLHPIVRVERTSDGALTAVTGMGSGHWRGGGEESLILALLPPIDPARAANLEAGVRDTLTDVRVAVDDWQAMLARIDDVARAMAASGASGSPSTDREAEAFLAWLRDGHFTFLGIREFRLDGDADTGQFVAVAGSGLGILRDPSRHPLMRDGEPLQLTPESRQFVFGPEPLVITKASLVSRVHRRTLMDYVGIKRRGPNGAIVGETRIVGLFTSQAYTAPPQQIPRLARKVAAVVDASGYPAGSHAAKALANVLDTFPRDELFRIGEARLGEVARGIVDLELRPRVRVFVRRDRFDRFVSALVYAPRERYSSAVRERIARVLEEAYGASVSGFTPYFPEGPLVRVHFILDRKSGSIKDVSEGELEYRISEITRSWDDQLAASILAMPHAPAGSSEKYAGAFSAGYAETFTVARAVEDIARIERLGPDRPIAIDFYREPEMPAHRVRAAIYRFDAPVPLSERVPVLENLGFAVIDERSYRVMPQFEGGRREVALHDMMLESADGRPLDVATHEARLEECFVAISGGRTDSDAFNRLVMAAGADWREVTALRAYAAYLRQIRAPFGLRYIADTLLHHAGITRDLIEWFHLRFDPDRAVTPQARTEGEQAIRGRIERALGKVQSLDEDRIIRHYVNLISATVRSNFFQHAGATASPETISFKLVSTAVDGAPEPRPFREIWVYSPRVEGIHLRFAPIARGGIRWSDRAQDFRTEVLGLCKAQQVKNTVIVPQGAKGGFVPKQMPRNASREQIQAEGVACYKLFIKSLLDITDNIIDGAIRPPARVVRHEADDPYLVVAADKGTATFSDIANAISAEHGHWLGDAFASGGSAGYDHKKMAITARGAWECVKRHFREMDRDIQRQPFTVAGVGDMSGDVFGNGMLLSPAIRLVAAFDHRDIFVDPAPDPAISLAERKRLFELPRSSWQDYDKSKISAGGGIFSRSSKSVPLSAEIRQLLGVSAAELPPAEIMRAILKLDVDLLWFGGIGTYVKSSAESDELVGDRANDGLRIAGADVRAKVIGEGANLGLTQRGRMEAASRGVRLNTDFIDNSAGVNSSDQEVNIKIALQPAVASGRLDPERRKSLLASMTDDVARACLENNYQQSLALSLAERTSARDIGYLARLMRALEKRGLLDRKLEALPEARDLSQRQSSGLGLTRPELAVLLSQSKIMLNAELLDSALPDEPAAAPMLAEYFPPAMRAGFAAEIAGHRLRREIVVTGVTNDVVNRGGPAFAVRLADETGRSAADVAGAFLAVCKAYDLPQLWAQIDALDGKVAGAVQLDLYARIQEFLIDQTSTLLRARAADPALAAGALSSTAGAMRGILGSVAATGQRERLDAGARVLTDAGVPASLATASAGLELLAVAPAATRIAHHTGSSVAEAAKTLLAVSAHLRIDELKAQARQSRASDYYDRLAASGAIATLEQAAEAIASDVMASGGDFARWEANSGSRQLRAKATLDEIVAAGEVTVSRLTVAASQVRDLARG
jgi:glutamate dehydrogenase